MWVTLASTLVPLMSCMLWVLLMLPVPFVPAAGRVPVLRWLLPVVPGRWEVCTRRVLGWSGLWVPPIVALLVCGPLLAAVLIWPMRAFSMIRLMVVVCVGVWSLSMRLVMPARSGPNERQPGVSLPMMYDAELCCRPLLWEVKSRQPCHLCRMLMRR